MNSRPGPQPPDTDQSLDRLVRKLALADWLVLAVVLLHQLVVARGGVGSPVLAASAIFAAFGVWLRTPYPLRLDARARLALETWAMAAFITVVVWNTGGIDSPLQSLYLLAAVLAALVLPATRLVLMVAAIAMAYVVVAARVSGVPVASAAFAGRALAALGPLSIVAWLTSQLGTALRTARRRAAELVAGDALTGLASRGVLIDAVRGELEHATRRDQPTAVMLIDLDGTQRLNELHGQEAGDAALKLVAEALKRALRDTDLAARWGGDEFAALLFGAGGDAVQLAAQRIRRALHTATFDAGTRNVRCSVSIGTAAAPLDGRDAATLLASAERRLERDRDLRRAGAGAAGPG